MDKHINLLNSLKTRLNNFVTNKNIINENEKSDNIEYARLKAEMINNNILSGLAVNEYSFSDNEVYAEAIQGKLNFHIYPTINKSSKSLSKKPEYKKEIEHLDREKSIPIKNITK